MEDKRLTIHRKDRSTAASSFAEDVILGLTSSPKFLLPKYFYDALGSAIFGAITFLPEYYPTRKESEILTKYSAEIAGHFAGEIVLIELGSGSATKTRRLIDALLTRQAELTFVPIDISEAAIESSAESLLETYKNLKIEAYAGDYLDVLKDITPGPGKRALVLFLGTSIGNVTPAESVELLRTIRQMLAPGDGLLLGTDLKKPAHILEPAYDDSLGITAAFNLNVLNHINNEFDADFDIRSFKHVAFYDARLGRVEMHLESLKEQTVTIGKLNLNVDLAAGERIHTENSYKYDEKDLRELALKTGFELQQIWQDDEGYFSDNLFIAAV